MAIDMSGKGRQLRIADSPSAEGMADSTSAADMALPAGSVCPRANAEYNQVGAPGEEHGAELVVRTELDQSLAPLSTYLVASTSR